MEGEARVDPDALARAPRAVALQFLADLLATVAGERHPPRLEALERLLARLLDGAEGGTSLHGCILRTGGPAMLVRREPARAAPPVALGAATVWDGRWRILWSGPVPEGAEVGALGADGLAEAGRPSGASAEAMRTTPAVRRDGRLLSAPLSGYGPGAEVEPFSADMRRRRILGGR
jgi:tRNA(Ile)-lysidine synthase